MAAAITEATKETFAALIEHPGWTLVDVWGPQCAPCLALMPFVEKLAEGHPEVNVVKLEAPKARRVCIEHRVMGLPTFLLFKEGAEVARISDSNLQAKQLEDWLEDQMDQERKVNG